MHLLIPNHIRGELERMYYLLINFYLVSLPFILTTSLYCVNLHVPEGTPTNFLPRCSTDGRKYFFSQRIVKISNELPVDTDFSSIESFKRTLAGFNFNPYSDI